MNYDSLIENAKICCGDVHVEDCTDYCINPSDQRGDELRFCRQWLVKDLYKAVIYFKSRAESAEKRNEEAEKTLERVRQILSDPLIINDPQNPKILRPVKRTSRQDVYTTLLKAQKAAGISDRWFPEEWNKK